jgi:hypothetical protein
MCTGALHKLWKTMWTPVRHSQLALAERVNRPSWYRHLTPK